MTTAKDRQEYLRGIVLNLPDSPGCYQYLDADGTIIYVGKAKRLKRRVSSYFNKEQQTRKTRLLVSKIYDIKYVVVPTEEDALLLENNLIKRYKPHYNVLLKDDKTYPSIAVTNEPYPRIFKTRQRTIPGASYYGPYSHVPTMYALLDLCRQLYLHNCPGPCAGHQSQAEYQKNIAACREILKGNTRELARQMRDEMQQLACEMRFEEAQAVKEQYELIENFQARSEVVSNSLTNIDVFSIESDEQTAFVNYLHITNGCVNQAFTFEYRKRLDETDAELLSPSTCHSRASYKPSPSAARKENCSNFRSSTSSSIVSIALSRPRNSTPNKSRCAL